jgi:hypothetical protein
MKKLILLALFAGTSLMSLAQECATEPVALKFTKAAITSFEPVVSYAKLTRMTNSTSQWPVIQLSLANFDTKPGFMGLESGTEKNQLVMNFTFNGKPVAWGADVPELTTGSYVKKASSDIEGSLSFSIDNGGETVQGLFRSYADVEGSAELLEIGADYVCFRINLKDKVTGDYVTMAAKVRLFR